MAVLRPVKLTITNYPEGQTRDRLRGEQPRRSRRHGTRERHLLPPPLYRGRRLHGDPRPQVQAPVPPAARSAASRAPTSSRCTGCVKDEAGNVVEVLCEYDPDSPRAATPPTAARSRAPPSTGWTPPPPSTRRCGCTTTCSPTRTPTAADKNFLDCLNPDSPGGPHRLQGGGRPMAATPQARPSQLPVHAPGLLLPGQPGLQAGPSGLQPQRLFEGQF